jgi:argininosuccinate synthase
MDSQVRELRDQFVTRAWSRQLYNGMYFSPEREFCENSVIYSQRNVTGEVRLLAYKGNVRDSRRRSTSYNRRSMDLIYLVRYTYSAAQAMLATFTPSRMPQWTHFKALALRTLPALLRLTPYG